MQESQESLLAAPFNTAHALDSKITNT